MLNCDHRAPNRPSPPVSHVLNPVWLLSDDERNMKWPWWRWFLRNPATNFYAVVLGVADCHRTVYWYRSPWSYADSGLNYGYTIIDGGFILLPFVSWRGRWVEGMIGWQTSGFFSASLRRANSPNATETP